MRLMITYYTGNGYKIADVSHPDGLETLTREEVASDCEDIISAIEVLPGVDYDKEGYADTHVHSTAGEFAAMVLK